MAKFKRGDKVVRQTCRISDQWCRKASNPLGVFVVRHSDANCVMLEGVESTWGEDYFDLYVRPQPEPVAVTEPPVQQIPGVPDGYRLVRIGAPKKGEHYVSSGGFVDLALCDWDMKNVPVVEPVVPLAPPTPIPSKVKVQLNRYLVGDLNVPATLFVLECTEEYIENRYSTYRLLGPSETLELEVEV